jgi:hypothetical protein
MIRSLEIAASGAANGDKAPGSARRPVVRPHRRIGVGFAPARHVPNATSAKPKRGYRACNGSSRSRERPKGRDATRAVGMDLEIAVEHASSHNTFGILFIVTFFASFAAVMIHFG